MQDLNLKLKPHSTHPQNLSQTAKLNHMQRTIMERNESISLRKKYASETFKLSVQHSLLFVSQALMIHLDKKSISI